MKLKLDKYYTESSLAEYCVSKTFEVLGTNWNRVIEPSAGAGSFLDFLPDETIAYDIAPEDDRIIECDYLTVDLPYEEKSLVIGNPPFGRANKLSTKFIKKSVDHSGFISFIQPISQLNNERTAGVDLLYSEDLGTILYSGKPVHCCLNIYKKNVDHKRSTINVPGLIECRHIFRSGKYKHKQELLDRQWDFRINAWGIPKLLNEDEHYPNEIVIECSDELKPWLKNLLETYDLRQIISCVSTPNLTSWRLRQFIANKHREDH